MCYHNGMKKCRFFYWLGMCVLMPIKLVLMLVATLLGLVLYLPFRVFFPTKIQGLKNLKKAGKGKLVAVNHFSNMDPVFVAVVLYPIVFNRVFVGKKELNKCKLIGFLLSCAGIIYIDRSKPDIKAMNKIIKCLKKGKSVIIFPEGTRNKNGESEDMQAIKSGVIFLSSRSNRPLVPVVIMHRIKLFRKNKLVIGEGETYTKLNKQETEQAVQQLSQKFALLRRGNKEATPTADVPEASLQLQQTESGAANTNTNDN